MTQEMYSKAIVSGGTGVTYSASNIWIIGRQQEKEGTEVIGYNFIINVEKSRYLKEKSKIPLVVTYEGGVNKFGGLIDLALESGHVIKPKMGWYQSVDLETGEVSEKSYRLKDTMNAKFWDPILATDTFKNFVRNKYQLPLTLMQREDDAGEVIAALEGDE
jgi:hypothetical protein